MDPSTVKGTVRRPPHDYTTEDEACSDAANAGMAPSSVDEIATAAGVFSYDVFLVRYP